MPALIFDCDGVLADTERYGHLPAFNETFAAFGIPVQWSTRTYAQKVLIGGGKERMASLFDDPEFVVANHLPPTRRRTDMLAQWHQFKTAAYTDLVAAGACRPGRASPGSSRRRPRRLDVAVASTSAEPSVRAVLEHAVGAEIAARIPVFAGDIVPAKKPDPAIYQADGRTARARPDRTVVVEDTATGCSPPRRRAAAA